ncbi:antibiotic biosynthesis monooxygenase family protein [Sphaerisporangium perillae]|uniref:antibiotic biosynthesis monooxygenase family protein n=1 Tax=Sphaerisporangium perillae TaxID=2935860 RepID=UPI00200E89D6|nr:antibiotic biosynthesis monooxygenase family protein [Sphaerisporangium perillae]
MIRSVLYLKPLPGKDGDLEDFFARHGVLSRSAALPGCLGAALHRPTGPGEPYLVTATWLGPSDYQQWLDDPWRQKVTGELGALLDGGPDAGQGGGVYTVVAATGDGTGDKTYETGGTPGGTRAGELA